MSTSRKLIPVFTSDGDIGAFLLYPYIFSRMGEWIGWVTSTRQVYSVYNHYVGYLSDEPRILRKQSSGFLKAQDGAPNPPHSIVPPSQVPLPPMLPEVPLGMIDVLVERPDLMPPIDFGALKEDMD